jgi:hypothetical protein
VPCRCSNEFSAPAAEDKLELTLAGTYDPANMAPASDSLLREGLAALGEILPTGYSFAKSSLRKREVQADAWILVRNQAKESVTCLVVARRRVETRDLAAIAATVARAPNPALLVSTYLAPVVKEKLRGFGIGFWDLAGGARILLKDIGLRIERDGSTSANVSSEHAVRSLCGEMAGRVARALVDISPPYALGVLADHSRVPPSYASRVVAFLGDAGLLQRQPRGKIEEVVWREILRRWSLDAPLQARGESFGFTSARGIPDFLARLGPSGFLHALTGEIAFATVASTPLPDTAVAYVDDVQAAVDQFALHPAEDSANIILAKPIDRSVFLRSTETAGLRLVSPSLMMADLADRPCFDSALAWMADNESAWRRR